MYNFSLSRLRRSIARFLVPVERPSIPLVFEDGNNYLIHSWAKYINIAEAQQCSVAAVDHRTVHASDSEHDFLFITLWHPNDFEAHMTAERCISVQSNSSASLSSSADETKLATPPSSPQLQDRVRFGPCAKGSYSLGCWLFHDPRPSVADLCSILYVVSVRSSCTDPHENPSVWFSRMAYGVLTKEYPGREVAGRNNRQATYDRCPIPNAEAAVLSIRQEYKSVWKEFLNRTYLEQARAEGREEGRQEGRREGRAASRAEAEAQIAELRRQLAM